MRSFDQRNSYLDDELKPLVGRVTFYKLHTSEIEDILDKDGQPLANPVYTNTLGQTNVQVFLKDNTDYTISFEKYIGNGDYTDEEDIDNWLFLYSCDNLWDVYSMQVDCDGVYSVDTIEDLKDLRPTILERNYVQVLGYNEIGDCGPVFYIWDSNSVENTNGGSIIGSDVTDTGRWKLVNTFDDEFDVRHFGVFGTQTRQLAETSMGSQILQAQTYANSIGKKLYFPAIDNDVTWYNIQGAQAITNGKFATNVWLFDTDDNGTHYITCSNDSDVNLYGDSDFVLKGDIVKTSWGKEATRVQYDPTTTLYFDSTVSTFRKTATNLIIQGNTLITGWTFDKCVFEFVGLLYDGCKIKNSRVTESLFATGVDYNSIEVFDTDVLDIDDFPTTSTYVSLKNQINSTEWDFKGRSLDSTCSLNTGVGVTIKDAVFVTGFEMRSASPVFKDCTGNVKLLEPVSTVTLLNSTIAFDYTGGSTLTTLSVNNSAIAFGKNITVTNLFAKDSTLNDTASTYYVTNVSVNGCELNVTISTNTQCIVQNSNINYPIYTGVSGFSFTKNTFNAQHIINVISADSVVNGIWNGNIGGVANPITFNIVSGNLAVAESSHNYFYEYNTGTFLPKVANSVIYKDGSNIVTTHSGSYESVEYGKIQFYVKDNKNIIIAQPYVESTALSVFHIGSSVNYKLTMDFIINYSTFAGTTLPMSFTQIKEYNGDVPNNNWINGYIYMPIIGRLDNNDPTVVNCKVYLKVEKI